MKIDWNFNPYYGSSDSIKAAPHTDKFMMRTKKFRYEHSNRHITQANQDTDPQELKESRITVRYMEYFYPKYTI